MKPTRRTPWEHRLTPKSTYTAKHPSGGSNESELTLSFESNSGVEYELECVVFAEYEPAQNGGQTDPSWSAHFYSPVAYHFRTGHGWKEISLSDSQKADILLHFDDAASDRDYDDRDYDEDRDYDRAYC